MAEAKNAQEAAKEIADTASVLAVATGGESLESSSTEPVLVRFEKPWGLYNKGEKATVESVQAARLIEKKIAVKA